MGLVPEPGPPGHAAPGKSTLPEAVRSTWDTVRGFGRLALGQPGPLQSLGRRMFAETMGTTAGVKESIPIRVKSVPRLANSWQRNGA